MTKNQESKVRTPFEVTLAKKLDEMYANPSSMKFVLHLVRSYIPIQVKTNKVYKFVDELERPIKCSLTGNELTDVHESWDKTITDTPTAPVAEEEGKKKKTPTAAYTGTNTNTFLCYQSVLALQLFVQDRLGRGDNRITFIINEEKDKYNKNKGND